MSKEVFAFINAILNGTAFCLLVAAFVMIKRKNIRAHATLMISACATSALFLAFYLTSHYLYGSRTLGLQAGFWRTVYLVVLIPHVLLAIVMLPMIGTTLWRASRCDFARHRRIARPTLWIWLYVSVTGVLVYYLLYHFLPTVQQAQQTTGG
jgi:putative membrane protein